MGGVGSGPKSTFNQVIADQICHLIAQGMTLKAVCEQVRIDTTSLYRWLENPEFRTALTHASSIAHELLADQLIEIADIYEDVNRGRLKSDNIKWLLARRAASKYGDKVTLDVNQTVSIGSAIDEALKRAIPQQTEKAQPIDIVCEVTHSTTDSESDEQTKEGQAPSIFD